jgi:hypothetical protein
MILDRLIQRLRPDSPDAETCRALARTEEIHQQVEGQRPEVQRHTTFARKTMRENELKSKIQRALRES